MEEAHPSKSRCREWLLSSSPWEKSVVRRKGWGVDHRGPLAGSWPLFRRIRRDGNRRGGKGWSGNRQARSGGTTRIGTGWLGENPSYWKGAGSTSVETVTQGPVVGVEGRRVVVGREITPAFVGLGTSVPVFRGGRRRLAAVCCQAVVICGSVLGCRGAVTREK